MHPYPYNAFTSSTNQPTASSAYPAYLTSARARFSLRPTRCRMDITKDTCLDMKNRKKIELGKKIRKLVQAPQLALLSITSPTIYYTYNKKWHIILQDYSSYQYWHRQKYRHRHHQLLHVIII